MPYFKRGNAKIYFLEQGSGFPVIAVHGLIENTAYWRLPGVTDRLADEFHVVSMDMRGHGNTRVNGESPGYDEETVAADILALADKLGFDRFHLLTHSTGGFAAVRQAMKDDSRFASLILTDSGSATSPFQGDPDSIRKLNEAFARSFENYSWQEIFEGLKSKPGPFFRGIVESGQSDEMMQMAFEMARQNNRQEIAKFVRSFYTDPDPCKEGLANISCPTLIIYGEKDEMFIHSSQMMADHINDAKLIRYEGIGHMTAIEAPDRLTSDILAFIRQSKRRYYGAGP
ncbi:MAG: alpha/beta hydrolase [Desulfobacterales bacterium]|nr:alpha/beta hydrolase [Desulfobacterales bacterium]